MNKKLWAALALVFFGSFSVLGLVGREIYRQAPPIPDKVIDASGNVLFTGDDIQLGKEAWQSMGGQEVGSIWGHGAYQAPDWSADWLHREALDLVGRYSEKDFHVPYGQLATSDREALEARLRRELRHNSFERTSGALTLSNDRADAVRDTARHFEALFSGDPKLASLRKAYAIPENAMPDETRRAKMSAFFFWTAWACVTQRPGSEITYTNNWPADTLVGNRPTSSAILWSVLSVVVLLIGVGGMASYLAFSRGAKTEGEAPLGDPLLGTVATPAMHATKKYFWTVGLLFLAQVGLGALTAHYGVEGDGFYGFPLAKYLPYAVTRTWHTQSAIFWIATAWLATGLYMAAALGGKDPKYQTVGVNFLFVCLLIIVVGSFAGQWFSIMQKMGLTLSFWFGDQGYEYVDLGRFWQIFLFVGLFVWLTLMGRSLVPVFRRDKESRELVALFGISTVAIGLFYGAGLMWGQRTHLAIAEYWRWWVVHLWVEGFFEVFATTVIAFLFTRLGLLRVKTASSAILLSTIVFLSGGIIGTLHHLYFTGTPISVLALGASFSALEVVPLVLVGFEACENWKLSRARHWVAAYRWPIYFFVAVAFWNMVGAGFFGFLINPPIALYYMQGLNTTAVHGHTALFGVYGMLGIGLALFCLRGITSRRSWSDKALAVAFWCMNCGLMMMVLLSLLPVGLLQTWASINQGLWYARSADFLQTPLLQNLRWLRVPGDVIFSIGVLSLIYFLGNLFLNRKVDTSSLSEIDLASLEGSPAQ